MREADDARLVDLIVPRLEHSLGITLAQADKDLLKAGMDGLKQRAKTVVELADLAAFYVRPRPLPYDDKALKLLDADGKAVLADLMARLGAQSPFTREVLEELVRVYAEEKALKLGKVAQPLRAALSGSTVSPPIFEVMELLGRDASLARLQDALNNNQPS
jgi:glutamyl-tRNA synthetase